MIRRSRLAPHEISELLNVIRTDYGFSKSVQIRISDELTTPAMTGIFRPMILLPDWAEHELDEQQMRFVIVHELIHVEKRDVLIQLAAFLVQVIHWFNPLVYLVARRIESFRELVCDQAVVDRMGQGNVCLNEILKCYGQTILQIASRSNDRDKPPLLMGRFVGTENQLIKQRIAMLVNRNQSRKSNGILFTVCLATMVAVGFTSAQASPSPATETQQAIQAPTKSSTTEQPLEVEQQSSEAIVPVPAEVLDDSQDRPIELAEENQEAESKPKDAKLNTDIPLLHQSKRIATINSLFGAAKKEDVFSKDVRTCKLVSGNRYQLKCEFRISEVVVEHPRLFEVKAIRSTELQFSAWLPGSTTLKVTDEENHCLLYTSPSPRDLSTSRMPSSA